MTNFTVAVRWKSTTWISKYIMVHRKWLSTASSKAANQILNKGHHETLLLVKQTNLTKVESKTEMFLGACKCIRASASGGESNTVLIHLLLAALGLRPTTHHATSRCLSKAIG